MMQKKNLNLNLQRSNTAFSESQMIDMIKNIKFFKEKSDIKESDYKDLVQGFTLQKAKAGAVVMNMGDIGT